MPTFRILTSALFICCLFMPTQVTLADFQNEASLALRTEEYNDGNKSDGKTLYYSYYFDQVKTATGPWELASFLQRSGSIFLGTVRIESELQTYNADFTYNYLGLNIANPDSPFVFGLTYFKSKNKSTGSTTYTSESDGYNLSIGYFIQRYTLISYNYGKSKTDSEGIYYSYETETNGLQVSTVLLGTDATAIALFASYSVDDYDNNNEFKFANFTADYYFNPRLGAGVLFSTLKSNHNLNDRKTLGLNVSYFLSPQFNLSLQYTESTPDNEAGNAAGLESEAINLSGSFYF